MPVCWALEEVEQPYEARLVNLKTIKEAANRSVQQFGRSPVMSRETSYCSSQKQLYGSDERS